MVTNLSAGEMEVGGCSDGPRELDCNGESNEELEGELAACLAKRGEKYLRGFERNQLTERGESDADSFLYGRQ